MKLPKFRKEDKLEKKMSGFLDKKPPKIDIDIDKAAKDEGYLNAAIKKHEADLKTYEIEAKAYNEISESKKNSKANGLSKDAVFSGLLTGGCILAMLTFEKSDVIHSKVMSFIPKFKL